jgi:hypothetical protein
MYYSTVYRSPVGELTLASLGDNLVGLWMAGQKYFGGTIPAKLIEKGDCPVLASAKAWLDRRTVSGRKRRFSGADASFLDKMQVKRHCIESGSVITSRPIFL